MNVEDYLRRSGDDSLCDGELEENQHGFCIWRVHDEKLVLMNVYGDGKYWNQWAENKARELGLKRILFATKRKPEAFVRKHGFTVTGYILERPI